MFEFYRYGGYSEVYVDKNIIAKHCKHLGDGFFEKSTLVELEVYHNVPGGVKFLSCEINDEETIIYLEKAKISLHDFITKIRDRIDYLDDIILDLFEHLNILNSYGYHHGDIKPDNIVLTEEGKFKFIDFGSCRGTGVNNRVCGTVTYQSPEIFVSILEDKCAKMTSTLDIWSLGIVFYNIITGANVFEVKNIEVKKEENIFYSPKVTSGDRKEKRENYSSPGKLEGIVRCREATYEESCSQMIDQLADFDGLKGLPKDFEWLLKFCEYRQGERITLDECLDLFGIKKLEKKSISFDKDYSQSLDAMTQIFSLFGDMPSIVKLSTNELYLRKINGKYDRETFLASFFISQRYYDQRVSLIVFCEKMGVEKDKILGETKRLLSLWNYQIKCIGIEKLIFG